jgi:hypothetical protein
MTAQAPRRDRRRIRGVAKGLLWGAGLAGAWIVAGAGTAAADEAGTALTSSTAVLSRPASDALAALPGPLRPAERGPAAVMPPDIGRPASPDVSPVTRASQPAGPATRPVRRAAERVTRAAVPVTAVAKRVADVVEPVTRAVQPVARAVQPVARAVQPVSVPLPSTLARADGNPTGVVASNGVLTERSAVLAATAPRPVAVAEAARAWSTGTVTVPSQGARSPLPTGGHALAPAALTADRPHVDGAPWTSWLTGMSRGEASGGLGSASTPMTLYVLAAALALLWTNHAGRGPGLRRIAHRPGSRPD